MAKKLAAVKMRTLQDVKDEHPPAAVEARIGGEVEEKPHQQLSVIIPLYVWEQVDDSRQRIAGKRETLRGAVLRLLKKAGLQVDDADIADRRIEAARRKSEILRRARGGGYE